MKKFFSFFAAMLVAVAANAAPVALPAVLDVTNVSFRSEGMPDFVIEEGQDYAGTYFDMGAHDSSNDTLLYAEWDVTIEPIKYNIAVDVYNTNSWRVQLYLLNQAGDTLKSLRYKGSSGQCGQFAIGAMDLSDLAAGDYKVRARAATAWSAMKLKDVIFEADYQGVNVNLPGTLLPAYAELSSGASVANHAIAFNPGTAPDEYAKWNVTFANAGEFNVSIDYTATNGHTYGVALLSADGQTEINAVAEAQAWDTGVKDLGAITVPAAGKYIVKLTNATQWSEAVLNSITFAAPYEPAMKTIYCKMDKAWWTADNAAVGIYAWGDNSAQLAAWPGVRMTPVEGETGVWSIELDINTYKNCIFTRVNGSGDIADWGAKTANQTIPTDENDLFTIISETATWGDPGCTGAWSKYEPAAPVVDEWAEIKFAAAAAADDIAEEAAYTVPGTEFALTLHDAGNKMVIDGNDCRFGTAEAYTMYNFRLKSGGASGSDKNYFTLNIPEAGTLRIAPRTGSNSATDRALIVIQGGETLYNQIVQESQAIEVQEGENTIKVYPYVDVTVAAGEVVVRYTAGMNFYAFAFKAGGAPEPAHTYTVAGSSAIAFGTAWTPANTDNDMVKQEDGTYKWEKSNLELPAGTIEFKVCQDHAWATCWPAQNYQLAIAESGVYTLTITFEPANDNKVNAVATKTGEAVVIPTIAMHGNFLGSWADTENFVIAEGDETASLKLTLVAGNYEFGMRIGGSGNWTANGVSFTRENASAEVVAGSGNLKLEADKDGDYVFTWTYATNTLSISFPVASGIDNTNVAVKAQKVIINGQLFIIRDGQMFNAQGQLQ